MMIKVLISITSFSQHMAECLRFSALAGRFLKLLVNELIMGLVCFSERANTLSHTGTKREMHSSLQPSSD